MESDMDSLLEFLLSKGQIPSFSFPLDTTMFAAESKKKSKVRHLARYSRDTKLAISELAPGQQRTVNGEKFEIGGLYFEYSRNKIDRAAPFFVEFVQKIENRVSLCLNKYCGWVSENKIDDLSKTECPVCITSTDKKLDKKNVHTYLLLKPDGLAPICVPHDDRRERPNWSTYDTHVRPIHHKQTTKKSSQRSGKAKLPAPDINDISSGKPLWTGAGDWKSCQVFLAEETTGQGLGTEFVLLNPGPDEEGFVFCSSCGASMDKEHMIKASGDLKHHRPYILEGKDLSIFGIEEKMEIQKGCEGGPAKMPNDLPVALGMRFRTDVAVFRFDLNTSGNKPHYDWTEFEFHGAVMALRDALQVKLVEKLELMNRELSAGYRLVSENSKRYVDIFVYDSVSGGAGLVTQLRRLESEMEEFLNSALNHLDGSSCLEQKACTRACVGCLLDFRNRIDHDVVNRPLGWSLARYFREERTPKANDFGINQFGEINRVEEASQSYKTFIGSKGQLSIVDNIVNTPSGKKWELVSPFFQNDLVNNVMRIDYFELYPKEITEEFDMRESNGEHKPLW
jgi:hypothetical protein